jgi:glycosyltransferase involved in cell wall biosynthesis
VIGMRVLMVTPGFHPIKGGTETVVRNLSIELNRIGVHTDVMTFNMERKWNPKWRGKVEEIDGITVFRIPALNWMPLDHSDRITLGINLIPGRFTNFLKQYDVIHFHELDFSFPLCSFFVKKPKIFHLHGFKIDYFKKYHLSRLILRTIADLYISITKQMNKELALLGIPEDKIRYLPHSVNTQLFHPQEEKKDAMLLFVGRITFEKGLHVLLKSLDYLKNPVQLVIVGPMHSNLSYSQDILKSIRKQNKTARHNIMYLGALDPKDIIKWYQTASIFVSPTFREAFGIVNLEALSCETPVISTNVGGIPEVIHHGENGIIVPRNNPVELANAIDYLLENKDVRIKFGYEGRKMVMEHFSNEIIIKKLIKIYAEISS